MFNRFFKIVIISFLIILSFSFSIFASKPSSFDLGYNLGNSLRKSKINITDENIFNSYLNDVSKYDYNISPDEYFDGYISSLYDLGFVYTLDSKNLSKDDALYWLMGNFSKYIIKIDK